MKDIPQTLKDKLKRNTRKTDSKVWIDWNNDGIEDDNEIINDDIISLTTDKKKEGKLGISVVDRATITIDNSYDNYSPKNNNSKWSGNVVPSRYSEISAGIADELTNMFTGRLDTIKPTWKNNKTSITLKDNILLLQKEDCPNKFYYNERAEDIIEEWLLSVDITDYQLDTTSTTINYNFDGMKMWDAINYINESLRAETYIEDGTFYFKTRLSLDYDNENSSVYTFDNNNSTVDGENVWEISEELGLSDVYNKIEIKSNPLVKQQKQIIYTGTEENSEITEEYLGSDINTSNELQLTYVDSDGNEQPTKNVPIVENDLSILDLTDESVPLYELSSGIDSIDYENGIITFSDTVEQPVPPDDHILRVQYSYYFNQIPAGKEKNFFIELDNPAINIDNAIIYARDESGNDLNVSFSDNTADIYVIQDVREDQQNIEMTIINNSGVNAILYGKENNRDKENYLIKGEPYKKTNKMKVLDVNQDSIDSFDIENTLPIQNDLITSNIYLKKLAKYLLWLYSEPRSKLRIKAIGIPHLQINDIVTVEQDNRDIDKEFIINAIKDKIKQNGEWETHYDLIQAFPSDWEYIEDGTAIINGNSEKTVIDTVAPDEVSNINTELDGVSKIGVNRVKITWSANNELDLSHYNIYRKLSTDSEWDFIDRIDKGTEKYIDNLVIYQGNYDYVVTAVDRNENESDIDSTTLPSSITVQDTQAPSPPEWSGDPINGFFKMIKLEWIQNDEEDLSYYEIWHSDDSGSTYTLLDKTTGNIYSHTGLANESTHYYKLKAVDVNGNTSNFNSSKSDTTQIIGENDIDNVFNINFTSNLNPDTGYSLEDLIDKNTSTGAMFSNTDGDGNIEILFEYPTEYFFDMSKIYTDVNFDYYVQIYDNNSSSWIDVAGNETNKLSGSGNSWNVTQFVNSDGIGSNEKKFVTSKLKIIITPSSTPITVNELKFWNVVQADEINAINADISNITAGNGAIEIDEDGIRGNDGTKDTFEIDTNGKSYFRDELVTRDIILSKFYTWRNTGLIMKIFEDIDGVTDWEWTDLATDSQNNIWIAYNWNSGSAYARKYDSKLTDELNTIDVSDGDQIRIEVDSSDNIVTYTETTTFNYFDFCLSSNDYRHVFYADRGDFKYRILNSSDVQQSDTTLYNTGYYPIGCSIDNNDNKHIVYCDFSSYYKTLDIYYTKIDSSGTVVKNKFLLESLTGVSDISENLSVVYFNNGIHVSMQLNWFGSVGVSSLLQTYYMRINDDITSTTIDESIIISPLLKAESGEGLAISNEGMYLGVPTPDYLGIRYLQPITNAGNLEDLLFILTP